MKRIAVFLSSKTDVPPTARRAVDDIGRWIGTTSRTLVYGGARAGMMERLAQTVRDNGGRVIGIVPQVLVDRGRVSDLNDTVFYTADLQDRKSTFMREAEAFIVLPGGIGTLDELFTVLAARMLEGLDRPVMLYNADGTFSKLISVIEDLRTAGFISQANSELFSVITNTDEAEAICR